MVLRPEQVVELSKKEYSNINDTDFKNLIDTIFYLAEKLNKPES